MKIDTKEEGDLLVLILQGEMDHHNLKGISLQTDSILRHSKPKMLILDMQNVPFCDSSGIAAVIGRYKTLKEWDGQMVLYGLSNQVRKVLNLGGVFNIVKEVQPYDRKK